MKKILLIAEKSELDKYRTRRVLEELEKRKIESKLVASNDLVFFTDKVFHKKEELKPEEFSLIYSIGNGTVNHYFIDFCSLRSKAKIWPSSKHLNMNDKFFEGMFLSLNGIKIPKTLIVPSIKRKDLISELVEEVGGYPCIAKKVTGSEGRYVGLINSSEEFFDFIGGFPHPSILGKRNVILQEYIKESKGTDFRVYCVGDEILGAIKRTSQGDDFRANVSLGGRAEKVKLTEEMIEYSKKIMKEGKLLFAGIDFIKGKDGFLVIEINTSADFQGFEKATGINVAGKIIENFLK